MRNLVKLIIIASALFLLSCHSEVPDFPDYPVEKCIYKNVANIEVCKSIYDGEITKEDCLSTVVKGTVETGSCGQP
jgi:hypothetical protein